MEKTYTKYDAETGEVLLVFTGSAEDAELNSPVVEGEYPSDSYTVRDGVPVKKPDSERKAVETSEAWARLRSKRNALLAASDWTQIADAPVDAATWALYRQLLRDLPRTVLDPTDFVWPTPPTDIERPVAP